jgi:hypothetical protein
MIWPVLQCTCNDNGVHGNVIITYADGAKTPVTSGGMCAQVRISPDGRTVGWLTGVHRDLWKDGEISFVPTALVLWRDGKLFRHIPGTNGDIIGWQFWNGGAQVALSVGDVTHRPYCYFLYDIATLRKDARGEFWGRDGDGVALPPEWAKAIAYGEPTILKAVAPK